MKRILLTLLVITTVSSLEAQNPYPVIPIDTVQYVSPGKLAETFPNDSCDYVNPTFKNATYRDTVRFDGYVLFDPRFYGLSTSRKATVLMADTFGRPWGGVEVMAEFVGSGAPNLAALLNQSKFYENMKPGTKVRVSGVIRTFRGTPPPNTRQGQSQVNVLAANVQWDNSVELLDLTPKALRATPVRIDSLMTGNINIGYVQNKISGEQWEGSYVELQNVTVFSRQANGANRWSWSVADDNGNAIDIYDFSGFYRNDALTDSVLPPGRFTPPVIGTRFSYLRGVVIEAAFSGQYRFVFAPLMPSDIGPVSYTPPTVASRERTPVMATSNDSVGVLVKIQQGSARVSQVKLFHTIGYSSTAWDSVVLTRNNPPNDTMTWYGFIPKRPNLSVVKYFIRPIDINGFSTNSPDTGGSYNAYLVNDNKIASIQDLQFSPYPNNQTIWHNDSITGVDVRGIVTATSMIQGTTNILTIQNGNALNSAMIINRSTGDATTSWRVGDSVSLTAFRVRELFGNTTLNSVAGTRISTGATLPAFQTLNIDTIAAISASAVRRPELCGYEGMLLRFDSLYVINTNADAPSPFGEFLVNHDATKTMGLRIDDISTRLPDNFNNNLVTGQYMSFAQGIFILSFSNWKLEPRDSNDLDFSGAADTENPVITLMGKNPDSLAINSSYLEPGYTAMDNKDGDITAGIIRTSNLDSSTVGSYLITYTVSDMAGNKDSVTRTVIVYNPTGVNENELVYAHTFVYPNPAREQLNLNVTGIQTLPLKASLLDIQGRVLQSESFNTKAIQYAFDLKGLENGIYFLNLESANGSKTIKFIVSK